MGRRGRVVQGGSCQCRSAPHRPDEPWCWPGHGGPRWAGGPEGQRENTPLPLSLLPSPLACRRARGGPPRPSERRLFWSAAASPWQRVNNVATIRAATCRSAAAALTPPALGSSPPLAPLGHGHRAKVPDAGAVVGRERAPWARGFPLPWGARRGRGREGAKEGPMRTGHVWGSRRGGLDLPGAALAPPHHTPRHHLLHHTTPITPSRPHAHAQPGD